MNAARDLRFYVSIALLSVLAGCGQATDSVSPQASYDTTPPPAPANLTIDPEAANTLHWDASSAPDVEQYQVYVYSPDPARDNAYVLEGEIDANATTYVFDSATDARTDVVRLRAVDHSGNQSAFSAALSVLIVPTAVSGGTSDPGDLNPMRSRP